MGGGGPTVGGVRWIWAVVAVTLARRWAAGAGGALARPAPVGGRARVRARRDRAGRHGPLRAAEPALAAGRAGGVRGRGEAERARTRGAAPDIPAAYWVQWLAGTALIPLVFALAAGGGRDGGGRPRRAARGGAPLTAAAPRRASLAAVAVAAAIVATYPPLIEATGDLLSEPLGALWLTARAARASPAAARARRGAAGRRGADAGEPARADPGRRDRGRAARGGVRGRGARAGRGVVAERRRRRSPRAAAARCSSGRTCPAAGRCPGPSGRSRPRRSGSRPSCAGAHAKDLPGDRVLDAVAAREPGLDRDAALRAAACTTSRPTRASTRAVRRDGGRKAPAAVARPVRAAAAARRRRCGSGTRCSCCRVRRPAPRARPARARRAARVHALPPGRGRDARATRSRSCPR